MEFFGNLVRVFSSGRNWFSGNDNWDYLIPVAINNMGGGQGASDFGSVSNISLAFGTLLFIYLLYRFSTGFIKAISILLGIILGTVAAMFMGKVDFSACSRS